MKLNVRIIIYLINLYDTDNIYNFDAIIYDGSIN